LRHAVEDAEHAIQIILLRVEEGVDHVVCVRHGITLLDTGKDCCVVDAPKEASETVECPA
jgi:hypothetical protein